MSGASRSFPQSAQSGSGAILAWATGTVYAQGQTVTNSGHTYTANDAHTAGATFAGDLASHWTLLPITKADVGLSNVDNTADTSKPVSTAQAAADALALARASNLSDVANAGTARTNLGLGTAATLASDTDGTLAANSDSRAATQKAVKTYVGATAGVPAWQATTAYSSGQVVSYRGALWAALTGFTSGSTFDSTNWTALTALPRLAEIEFYGHSFVTGTTGPTKQRYGYARRVGKHFGIQPTDLLDYSNGGSQVGGDATTGGWDAVFADVGPVGSGSKQGHPNFPLKYAPWGPQTQVASLNWGTNEDGTSDRVPFINALRACAGHKLCAAFGNANDAAVSGTGGFNNVQGANLVYTGDRMRGGGSAGATLTVVAPAWWPAGRAMWLFFLSQEAISAGSVTTTKNGVASNAITLGAGAVASGVYGMNAVRVASVSAGNTVVATIASLTGGSLFFDRYGVEASPQPLVIIHNVTPKSGPPATDVSSVNTSIATLVTELQGYGGNVVLFDAFTAISVGGITYPDQFYDTLHPNNLGHALLASGLVKAIQSNPFPDVSYLLSAT